MATHSSVLAGKIPRTEEPGGLKSMRSQSQTHSAHTVHTYMLNHVQFFVTLWTIAHQAPLSVGFSRQENWSGLPFSSPGNLPNPGIEPASLVSPALAPVFM